MGNLLIEPRTRGGPTECLFGTDDRRNRNIIQFKNLEPRNQIIIHRRLIAYSHYQSNRSQVTDHQPLIWPYITNICAICRSYIGHIWAIRKLYISHVQPTVQATDGP